MTRRSSRSSGLLQYFLLVGGGGGGITKSLPGGDLLLLPSNGHGRDALVPRVYSAFKMAALSG